MADSEIDHAEIVLTVFRVLVEITFMAETAEEAYQDVDDPESFRLGIIYRLSAIMLATYSLFGIVGSYKIDKDCIKISGTLSNFLMFAMLVLFSDQDKADPIQYYLLGGACAFYSSYKLTGASKTNVLPFHRGQKYCNAASYFMSALALVLFGLYESNDIQQKSSVLICAVLSGLASLASLGAMAGRIYLEEDDDYEPLDDNPGLGL